MNQPVSPSSEYISIEEYDYNLPQELIAQHPIRPRDHSRLLIVNRNNSSLEHKQFYNIVEHLNEGDVLVMNNSKVIRARVEARKPTGGKVEIFLLNKINATTWECLIGGKGMQPDVELTCVHKGEDVITGTLQEKISDRTWQIQFTTPDITKIGDVPLPPYITERAELEDYQTVYAEPEGSVAAPTAGLHFTDELLETIRAKGVHTATVTLHVGLGTFAPVKADNIHEHVMHSEYGILPRETAELIADAKKNGNRVIAVGTTAVRTLESFAGKEQAGWIDTYITPGYKFKVVDAMVTNFHLPKSTLLILISAFANKKLIDKAYAEAIAKKYRFFSFGDAMFIA